MRSELAKARKVEGRYIKRRGVVIEWLKSKGHKVSKKRSDRSLLDLAHEELEKPLIEEFIRDNAFMSACYVRVISWALNEEQKLVGPKLPKPERKLSKPQARRKALKKGSKWKHIRYAVFKRDGNHCACCGRCPKDGFVMHIDHIKPLSTHWELRCDMNNLQVLCSECNSIKACDDTDWREKNR